MQQTISFILEVRLLGSLPHLSALPLEPPHSLLLPLGPHGGGGGGARTRAPGLSACGGCGFGELGTGGMMAALAPRF